MRPTETPVHSKEEEPRWWQRTWLLAAVLFAVLLLNGSGFIFHGHFYEADDYAANSLQILKAKHFQETVGNYSRFGFHHPGPAFFYVLALGEILFSDLIHLVPTPFNAQIIALFGLNAFFFSATLALIARRLGVAARVWFLGLALLFAIWHFGAVGKFYDFIPGGLGLLCPWPPCFTVLPFLCFFVAAASVASDNGKDMPLMILTGCFLVHGHVAMPLFIGPLALLAYVALWLEARRIGARPWNLFPRQHWFAVGIIALFLFPIAVNFFAAHPSNLERIVEHVRTRYGEGKGMLQSIFYFVHFGAYTPYQIYESIPAVETFDARGVGAFLLLHWRVYSLWAGSILFFVLTARTAVSVDPAISKFRKRLGLMMIAATGLSLVWGTIQEGPMFDFNALFIFAIYYGWLLLVALSAAAWIANLLSGRPARIRIASLIVLALAAPIAFQKERRHFRAAPDEAEQRHFAETVDHALVLDPAQPKFFNFDWQAGGQTTRVALYLERRGINWWVREDWPLFFGEEHIIRSGKSNQPVPTLSSSFWGLRLPANPLKTEGDPNAIVLPLTRDYDLVLRPGK
ncbi:MAG: hypothetical protein ACJ8NS_10645 [Chthoniobacterales bacterium]